MHLVEFVPGNLYGRKEVKKMGIADTRAMKFVVNEMQKRTKELEKKLDIFIDNQNDLAKMVATNYELLKVIADELNIKELPKPLIEMELE